MASLYGADDTAPADWGSLGTSALSTSWSYEFEIEAAGGASGLTSGGESIVLEYGSNNATVNGIADGVIVFTLVVDGSGQ